MARFIGDRRGRWTRSRTVAALTLVGAAAGLGAVVATGLISGGAHDGHPSGTSAGPGPSVPSSGVEGASSQACSGTSINPNANLQAAIDAGGEGSTLCLAASTYRITEPLTPKEGDRLIGQAGTEINGAQIVTGFTRTSGVWGATAHLPATPSRSGECFVTECALAEDVYFNGRQLTRSTSREDIGPGHFYEDYAANRLYLGDDPTGAIIEQSVAPHLLAATDVGGVALAGIVFIHSANAAQQGAIDARGHSGHPWTVENNVVAENHGAGIAVSIDASSIRGNRILRNGQLGISIDYAVGMSVLDNEIANNNTQGYSARWEAGGSKFWATSHLTVRGNEVHDNNGPGLWTDTDNTNVIYENNRVTNNAGEGIIHEISFTAVITHNLIRGNGRHCQRACHSTDWVGDGAGICVCTSSGVTVSENTLADNGNAIALVEQDRGTSERVGIPYVTRDDRIHANDVTLGPGERTGLQEDRGDRAALNSAANQWDGNVYHVSNAGRAFAWGDTNLAWSGWRALGQDAGATLLTH